MIYTFKYYYDVLSPEYEKVISADSGREAVLQLFDTVGICNFGCICEDGSYFIDDDFENEKEIIRSGC